MRSRMARLAAARQVVARIVEDSARHGPPDDEVTPPVLERRGRVWRRVDRPDDLPALGFTFAINAHRVYVRTHITEES